MRGLSHEAFLDRQGVMCRLVVGQTVATCRRSCSLLAANLPIHQRFIWRRFLGNRFRAPHWWLLFTHIRLQVQQDMAGVADTSSKPAASEDAAMLHDPDACVGQTGGFQKRHPRTDLNSAEDVIDHSVRVVGTGVWLPRDRDDIGQRIAQHRLKRTDRASFDTPEHPTQCSQFAWHKARQFCLEVLQSCGSDDVVIPALCQMNGDQLLALQQRPVDVEERARAMEHVASQQKHHRRANIKVTGVCRCALCG
mmetsp:Transcript_27632/g.47312  ORF Transcript_27632/g.47312 Transcript_27632/m.47312 type:complete len:251 (+) Transcript_27632:23-775(+)